MITLIYRDLDTDEIRVFKAPKDTLTEARSWAFEKRITELLDTTTLSLATERASDLDLLTAFIGDCQELKI